MNICRKNVLVRGNKCKDSKVGHTYHLWGIASGPVCQELSK